MARRSAWLLLVASIVLGAVAQASTALPGQAPIDATSRALWASASLALLWLQLVLTMRATTSLVAGAEDAHGRTAAVWSGVVLLSAAVAAVVWPPLVLLVAALAGIILPPAAAGRRDAWRGFVVFARSPFSASAAVVVTLVVGVALTIVALLSGFFLATFAGAFLLWILAGVAGAALLVWWTRLWRRATTVHTSALPTMKP